MKDRLPSPDILTVYPFNMIDAILTEYCYRPYTVRARGYTAGDAIRTYIPGVEAALLGLREQEAEVLRKRFRDNLTLKKTGELLGLTTERVRQIQVKAMRKLGHPSRMQQCIGMSIQDYVQEDK